MVRRTLLVLVLSLIVARPVVLGEDPGLLSGLSEPTGLVFTLLWMIAAVAWAGWRQWGRPAGGPPAGRWGSALELAFAALVVMVFVSAEVAARYKHPARLIAWEWVGLLLALFLVRRLVVTPADQNGLFAVLLAGALSLSAHGIYQREVEMPRVREELSDPEKLRERAALMDFGTDERSLERLRERMEQNNIYGTYAHPNSYAGFLALLLPGMVGAAVVFWRRGAPGWQTALAAAGAALGCAALWMTHSRGAILATVLAGVLAAAVVWRRFLRLHKGALLAAVLALAAAGYGVWQGGLLSRGVGKESGVVAQRLQYWRATWEIIDRHPWLGIGPGNFGNVYPRYREETAYENIKDPHDFALEVWAASGLFALLALLAVLGIFFSRMTRALLADTPEETAKPQAAPTRWEFYFAGMFGLLLGFVLRARELPPEGILMEAYAAALRSVVWFAGFALYEQVAWTSRGRALALTAGVLALLLNLCVSGGINFPSVAGPLWVAVALALNALPTAASGSPPPPPEGVVRRELTRTLPLPVLGAVTAAFFLYVFFPITNAAALTSRALHNGRLLLEKLPEKPLNKTLQDLQGEVLAPLHQAAEEDPDNARVAIELAQWYGWLWEHFPWWANPRRTRVGARPGEEALRWARRAQALDPEGREPYWTEYQLEMRFAARLESRTAPGLAAGVVVALLPGFRPETPDEAQRRQQLRQTHYRQAAEALLRYLPYDPRDAVLRYHLADALFRSGDRATGREQAGESLLLHRQATRNARKLSDQQLEQVREWLRGPGRR